MNIALEIIQIALILVVLIGLVRLAARSRSASRGASATELDGIRAKLDAIEKSLNDTRSQIGDFRRDQEILDELEESVMDEWASIIEEKLGKRPVMVACPSCGYAGGLEPNLLADVDQEYGCPNCGSIFAIESLRESYPDVEI